MTIILTACGGSTPAAVSSLTPTPVEVVSIPSADIVIASAVVAPLQVVQLGFTISSLVKEISVKEGDKVQAGQSLVILNTPDLEYSAKAAEAAYQSASTNADLQNADKVKVVSERNGHVSYVSVPRELYLIAKAGAAQAQAAMDIAKTSLSQATLTAPFDGIVASIDVIPGEFVQANQAVVTLASLDRLQIKTTDLSERDIIRVKIEQSVSVYIKALNVTVTGKVIRISPIAETVGGDVVYPVNIQLDNQPAGLLWGMTAEVQIKTIP